MATIYIMAYFNQHHETHCTVLVHCNIEVLTYKLSVYLSGTQSHASGAMIILIYKFLYKCGSNVNYYSFKKQNKIKWNKIRKGGGINIRWELNVMALHKSSIPITA